MEKVKMFKIFEGIRFGMGIAGGLFMAIAMRKMTTNQSLPIKVVTVLGGTATAWALGSAVDNTVNFWERFHGIRNEDLTLTEEFITEYMKS